MGVGIGIIFATIVMSNVKINFNLSNSEIEKRARKLGMEYPSEFKVIDKDVVK